MVVAHRYNLSPCARRCACSSLPAIRCPARILLATSIVTELKMAVTGTPVSGDVSLWDCAVTDMLVARMPADHVLERRCDGMTVITPVTALMWRLP